MERDGWIARRRDASDQRIVRVYLTDKAQALHEEARASFRELDYEMGSALSSEEQETLRQSLMKVYRYLEQETRITSYNVCYTKLLRTYYSVFLEFQLILLIRIFFCLLNFGQHIHHLKDKQYLLYQK